METKTRISGEERRKKILESARPLFAMNGFKGTSVREIAKAANVSEALLYKHFKSKEEIYNEFLEYAVGVGTTLIDEIQEIEPGAKRLVVIVYLMFEHILFDLPGHEEKQSLHERLLFHSLLERGTYARKTFKRIQETTWECLEESYRIAQEQALMVEMSTPFIHRSWFVHHLAMALNLCHLPTQPVFEYRGSKQELVEHATLFALRGIGLSEEAIKRFYNPAQLKVFRQTLQQKDLNG